MSDYAPRHSINADPEDDEELPAPANVLFGNRAYDLVKLLALIVFPALGTAYFGIAGIWGLPAAEQVVGTIVVVDTFLGGLLGMASKQYNNSDAKYDGHIVVLPGEDEDTSSLNVSLDPNAIAGKDEILVKVQK